MSKETSDAQSWTREFSHLFALIIGINEYESEDFPSLHSPVRDAGEFKNYLTECLCVPESKIRILVGKDASHNAIVDSLASFEDDARINVGDPIVIFFAGHSSEVLTPSGGWQAGGQSYIQSLVPQNYCTTPGLEVPCIPDRTIGALLEGIAEKKGNNITVVLDCCHSASNTRGINDNLRIRSATFKQNPDYAFWHPTPRFRNRSIRSHILITACSSELATEADVSSRFSTAFLQLLRSIPPDKLRYSQIPISIAPIYNKKPHIEGVDRERFLFGAIPLTSHPAVYHTLFFDEQSSSHIINAGLAHGVTDGTTFDMKSDASPNVTTTGTVIVEKAMPFYSMVKSCNNSSELSPNLHSAVVVQKEAGTRPHHVRLYITRNHRYQTSQKYLCSLLDDSKYNLHNILLVDQPDEAHLEVSVNRTRAIFQLLDKRAIKYGVHYRFPRVDTVNDKVASFLEAACNFYWELDRVGENTPGVMDNIEVAFYSLKETQIALSDTNSMMGMEPLNVQDLFQGDEIDIVVGDERRFGVKITNNGLRGLYPILQYFDCRHLNVPETYYSPPTNGTNNSDVPLKAEGGSLTIGYGSGGMTPLRYRLQEGQELTIGFLKLFVFTRPMDPSFINISQFTQCSVSPGLNPMTQDTWGTRVIPIIQRRLPKQAPIRPTSSSRPSTHASGYHAGKGVDPHLHAMSRRSTSLPSVQGA